MSAISYKLLKVAPRICLRPHRFNSSVFKSALSLENFYPNSSLKLTTPSQALNNQQEKFNGYIPLKELGITYSRSSGPGGQNVNKVNTKTEVRFHLNSANWISDDVKSKLLEKFKNKITNDGFLIFRSGLTRSQHLNLADCLEKIRSVIRSSSEVEKTVSEETAEKLRRRQEKAIRERLALKRVRAQVKTDRQSPTVDF